MNILSLFDGISCARQALNQIGIKPNKYFASEVDKYAIQIAQKNFPSTIQVGSVVGLETEQFKDIDLLIGGSPCQDLSIAKKDRKGLEGERSGLFWEYVRILEEVKPKYFVLENVNSMSKEAKLAITEALGIEPIMINASLVSAQNRKRLFWVGRLVGDKYETVEIPQPEDKGIVLKDILESGETDRLKSYYIDANYHKGANWNQYKTKGRRQLVAEPIRVGQFNSGGQGNRVYSEEGKSITLASNSGGLGSNTGLYLVAPNNKQIILDGKYDLQVLKQGRTEEGKLSRKLIREETGKDSTLRSKDHKAYFGKEGTKSNCLTTSLGAEGLIINKSMDNYHIRKLTPIECERLQGLPDNYTEGVSNTQRYKALGNAFNADVVAYILSFIS